MIPLFKVFMDKNAHKSVRKVLESGFIGQGPKVEEFESNLKEYFGVDYISTVNAATSAEHLALHQLKNPIQEVFDGCASREVWPGLKDGDEVLTTPLTCTATNWPILANNLKIKWVDVDENTLNMDLVDLERKITKKTKVIFVVHWGGYPVDLDRLDMIARNTEKRFGFKPAIIEDCAHAMGSTYNNKPVGSYGNWSTFSFQAIKHITTGDGGILITPDRESYDRSKLLRWYGINRDKRNYKGKDFRLENDIAEWGYKFHMNDINATIGIHNLPHIPELLMKNRKNAEYFNEQLKDIEGIQLMDHCDKSNSAYWLYTIRVLNDKKQEFIEKLKQNGIMASQVHNRNDINSCVEEYVEDLPNLDILEKELVCIPVGWWLSEKEREYIVNIIRDVKI